MKRRVVSFFLAALMLIAVTAATAADTNIVDSMEFQGEGIELTLEKAVEIVMTDNPAIMKSELDLEQAKVEYDKGERGLRKLKRSSKQELAMMGIDKDDFRDKDSIDYLQYIALPELSNEFTLDSAQRSYDATVEGVKADLEQSYYSLLQAEELKQISLENMEISKDLYEKTKKKYELGLISKQEVLNSELNYINAKNEYKSAENGYKATKMMFNIKLGNDVMTELKLTDDLKYVEFEPVSIAEAVQSALDNRYEVKALEYAYEMAKINKRINEKKYPEFTYQYKVANMNYKRALRDLEDVRRNIELEVRSNYMDLLQKKEEIESGQKAVQLAEEALKISQVSYDAGMSVMTDVQKAQIALKQARLGLSKAILDYNLAVLKFEDSIGVGRISTSAVQSTSMGSGSNASPMGS